MTFDLRHGDCVQVMASMEADSVDSIVTDPPYGLGFMGKEWDHGVPGVAFWVEMLRVLKPGGHLLAFGGTRTFHRMTVAIEDAGFEVRDCLSWLYGSGFPKSLDVSKAIDKAAGAQREVVGEGPYASRKPRAYEGGVALNISVSDARVGHPITTPATAAAQQWQGWGTALKPAWEPIIMARKPLVGTVAENVLQHGTGGLNIDGSRIGTEKSGWNGLTSDRTGSAWDASGLKGEGVRQASSGRWPANLIHDGSDEVAALFPSNVKGQVGMSKTQGGHRFIEGDTESVQKFDYGKTDSGSAARFFYCAKANKKDRNEGLGDKANRHPTVKPTALMRHLVKLVTQPDGIVLDPFMGSGSTGKAAILEGFRFIGIDQEAEYVAIAERRVAHAARVADEERAREQVGLFDG